MQAPWTRITGYPHHAHHEPIDLVSSSDDDTAPATRTDVRDIPKLEAVGTPPAPAAPEQQKSPGKSPAPSQGMSASMSANTNTDSNLSSHLSPIAPGQRIERTSIIRA